MAAVTAASPSEEDDADLAAAMRQMGKKAIRKKRKTMVLEPSAYPSSTTKFLDKHMVLILNADYQPLNPSPISVWTWQEAVKAIFAGKVTVVDEYPDLFIRTVDTIMPLPSVIAMNEYVPSKYKKGPSFTRRNVYLRDGYRCQYCGETFAAKDLTFDHVFPRSLGGSLSWENTVTCCKKCNSKKGNLTLNQLKRVGMELLSEPRQPTVYELASMERKFSPRRLHDTWQPFLPEYL
eukprot:CAMPEP_0178968176 /NCGR_PEP_ID=MMETSP0789-20121207/18055_1 /TAXON_ID=3005 /ORGANISM="Rhizosolenia setigera, Strain CCMP 1694" /LENGTH=234 /DNA_ID=CAMNT_0020653969 /DNA_START=367 /DNA_END=1071 /DNA_ORIENTATION=-